MSKKKELMWSFIAVILAVISIWAVISQAHHFSLERFAEFITDADPLWLGVALICMLSFIFFEGESILIILKAFGYPKKQKEGIVYSAADIYFSAITPSASGGQPASLYFMIRDGIPMGVATITLLVNLVVYTISILCVGLLAVIIRPSIFINFNGFSKFLIIVGYIILSCLAAFFIMIIRHESILQKIIGSIFRLLHRFKLLKNIDKWEAKLQKNIEEYKNCADMLEGHKDTIVKAFLCNFVQRISQTFIPAVVVLAMKRSADSALSVWVTQVFVTIGSNCVPIPGAMGVSDYLLLDGLGVMMGNDVAINLDLLSRTISFYGCMVFSLIVIGIAYFLRNKRKYLIINRKNEEE